MPSHPQVHLPVIFSTHRHIQIVIIMYHIATMRLIHPLLCIAILIVAAIMMVHATRQYKTPYDQALDEHVEVLPRHIQLQRFEQLVEQINSDPRSTWKARMNYNIINAYLDSPTSNPFVNGVIRPITEEQKIKARSQRENNRQTHDDLADDQLPLNFNSLAAYPLCHDEYINLDLDQSNCGSCWSVSTSWVLSARFCMKYNVPIHLSSRSLLSNCKVCGYGCGGGTLEAAFRYVHETGIPTGSPTYQNTTYCQNYPFPPCAHHIPDSPLPQCDDVETKTPPVSFECDNDSTWPVSFEDDNIKSGKGYHVWGTRDVKKEMFKNGPIQATYNIYDDFLLYESGIYIRQKGSRLLGGHAVSMVGWGYDEVLHRNFTIVKNSWGNTWGENGFVRFNMGVDNAGIEDDGMAATFD